MLDKDFLKLADDLEQQELEAPTGVASPQVYLKLLAIYLYQNELLNAKFLWKRIPGNVKSTNPEIGLIWNVGKHLWKRNFPATYEALNIDWSEAVAEIMNNVKDAVRKRAMDLICQAYSSISLQTLMGMTGFTPDECLHLCNQNGWSVEQSTNMIYPLRRALEPVPSPSSEDQLNKLTDFVNFLEN